WSPSVEGELRLLLEPRVEREILLEHVEHVRLAAGEKLENRRRRERVGRAERFDRCAFGYGGRDAMVARDERIRACRRIRYGPKRDRERDDEHRRGAGGDPRSDRRQPDEAQIEAPLVRGAECPAARGSELRARVGVDRSDAVRERAPREALERGILRRVR